MKKVFSFFLLFVVMFYVCGCSNNSASLDLNNVDYKDIKNKDDFIYNVKSVMENVNGVNFKANIRLNGKQMNFDGKMIFGETLEKSIINFSFGKNNLYLKNGKVYLNYYYNNTNVIVKDNLDNLVNEISVSLGESGIKCDVNKINEFLKNKSLYDINYDLIKDYVVADEGYIVSDNNVNFYLDSSFLLKRIEYSNDNIIVDLSFDYGNVNIKIPVGYNFFTLDFDDVKKLLRKDNIIDFIR